MLMAKIRIPVCLVNIILNEKSDLDILVTKSASCFHWYDFASLKPNNSRQSDKKKFLFQNRGQNFTKMF